LEGVPAGWLDSVAADLKKNSGASLVIVGDAAPAAGHALAHAMNHALAKPGRSRPPLAFVHIDPVEVQPVDQFASLRELVGDMNEGRVNFLLILGGNPAFTAPADLSFAQALLQLSQAKERVTAHVSLYQDET